MITTMFKRLGTMAATAACCLTASATVLDNFNDNTKTDWTDATFVKGFGLPTEAGGKFVFAQPPAGQAIFSASQKTSQSYELKEGRTVEMRVDVTTTGGKDSFAILGFVPNTGGNSPLTLNGYGFAKSTTDILITKSIGKYFYADHYPDGLPNENITMTLTLTGKGGNMEITARVLDKANNNAVLWEKTVIDTPAADVLASGSDSPAAPYVTTGYFTLYLYQDFDAAAPENPYTVVYDNAEVYVNDLTVVDNFNDNTKTDWADATFIKGFGLPTEADGKFTFVQPPAGQAIFSASAKTTRSFELKEGEQTEFSVDVVTAGGKDSFAILTFVPNVGGNNPLTLNGYGFAKSTTDILITKSIGKYFYADHYPDGLPNENITLTLRLLAKDGSLEIRARVLDKANNNAVLWERTVIDTPAADVLASGTDSPAAPYLTTGYPALYLYQDFDAAAPENPYIVVYDNLTAFAPPLAANVAPSIASVSPANSESFLPASTKVSFTAADDKALSDESVAVVLNGTKYTKATGLTVTGSGNSRSASLGGLVANATYVAQLIVVDSEGLGATNNIAFDTFLASNLAIELEDYNYGGGVFIDNPSLVPEGSQSPDSFSDTVGVQGTDFNDTRTSANGSDTKYRTQDPVRMQHTLDTPRAKYVAAGGPDNVNGVYDYDIGDIGSGEWLNYTRTFPAGSYEVYLREAIVNIDKADSVLELVTGDRTQPDQTTRLLGSFLGVKTGFQYRNFALTDGTGANKAILRLSGVTTLRLRHVTADTGDGGRYMSYLMFVPVADPGIQRATVTSLSPGPDSVTTTTDPTIVVAIQNRDTSLKAGSVKLTVNGGSVTPVVAPTADGATVTYKFPTLPVSGALNTAQITFTDNLNVDQTSSWSFTVEYISLDPASRFAGTGVERGINARVVQATQEIQPLEDSLQRAEDQLAPNSKYAKSYDLTVVAPVINFTQEAVTGGAQGYFQAPDHEDAPIPGEDRDLYGDNDYAMDATTYLELPAGIVRFGILSDDGFKVQTAATITPSTLPISFANGNTADLTFDVVVTQAGLYPFRLVWYERGGGAQIEWFTVNRTTGERTLINDVGGVRAYATVKAAAPTIVLQSSATLGGTFSTEAAATVNTSTKTVTVDPSGDVRFYRLSGASGLKIDQTSIAGGKVVLKYSQTVGSN